MITCHDSSTESLILNTTTPYQTEQIGEQLGRALQTGDLILLSGDLGAGKTCLTRGLARGWGAEEKPTSPTFTLINEYHKASSNERFYHADCYRISSLGDAISTGIEDLFNDPGVLVIEWPERIMDLLPEEYLIVEISGIQGDGRTLTLTACGQRPSELLDSLSGTA